MFFLVIKSHSLPPPPSSLVSSFSISPDIPSLSLLFFFLCNDWPSWVSPKKLTEFIPMALTEFLFCYRLLWATPRSSFIDPSLFSSSGVPFTSPFYFVSIPTALLILLSYTSLLSVFPTSLPINLVSFISTYFVSTPPPPLYYRLPLLRWRWENHRAAAQRCVTPPPPLPKGRSDTVFCFLVVSDGDPPPSYAIVPGVSPTVKLNPRQYMYKLYLWRCPSKIHLWRCLSKVYLRSCRGELHLQICRSPARASVCALGFPFLFVLLVLPNVYSPPWISCLCLPIVSTRCPCLYRSLFFSLRTCVIIPMPPPLLVSDKYGPPVIVMPLTHIFSADGWRLGVPERSPRPGFPY